MPTKLKQNVLLNAALWYASKGIAVVPLYSPVNSGCSCPVGAACGSPGKHPRTPHGKDDASANPDTIHRWWAEWPNANVGICPGDRVLVLDVDPRSGGAESLASLEAAHGALPATYEVRTGGNGRHLYFRPNGTRVRNRTLAPGVELIFNLSREVGASRRFFAEHADRILFGTDIGLLPEAGVILTMLS